MPVSESLLLDGKSVARETLIQLKSKVDLMKTKPTLAVIVAGQDKPSLSYVKMKQKWAAEIGANTEVIYVDENLNQEQLLQHIVDLNHNPNIHGILVQHPLPNHIDESKILSSVDIKKDVDGISPMSIGLLASRMKGHRAATPLGIIRLLDYYNVPLRGAHVVIAGCSIILGRPMALMLLERDATVCVTHKYTKNMDDLLAQADIVISATGVPGLIRGEPLKQGVVAIDCGYSVINGEAVGDIRFDEVKSKAKFITPVPGGVGPMTVATLLSNLVDAYWEQQI